MLCPICKTELPKETVVEGSGSRQCSVCGASLDKYFDETESVILEKIGRFTILHTLGEGGFGTVYKAKDAKLDRIVAIKVLRPNRSGKVEMEQRLVREAKAASLLNHPGIVKVFDLEELGPIKVLIEEYVEGETLDSIIRQKKLTARERLELIAKIADSLAYAHDHRVIHRDIKPSNIILDKYNQPRILDFGLAKREGLDVSMTEEGQLLGTIIYMSPEQANGQVDMICGASDQYSLGVILYQLLTDELPFRGSGNKILQQIITDEPPSPHSLSDAVTLDLETICLKTLSKKLSDRYASCADFAKDLRLYLNNEPVHARPVGPLGKLLRWSRRHRTFATSIAAISAILIFATIISSYFAYKSMNDLQIARQTQLRLLLDGESVEVRPVILSVRQNLNDFESDLRQMLSNNQIDQRKRARAMLALSEKDTALQNQLYGMIDQLHPPDAILVNDLLSQPPSEDLEKSLWAKLKDPQISAQQRLLATIVLARAKPRHPGWIVSTPVIVRDLLDSTSTLQLPLWMEQLKPLWPLLQSPLVQECLNKNDNSTATLATTVFLKLYKDDVSALTRLLGAVPQNIAPMIIDHLKSLNKPALILAELKTLHVSGSERSSLVTVPAGLPEPTQEVRQKIEASSGIIHSNFAIVSALPWPDVNTLMKSLAASGYRPIRFRPYPTSQGLRAAAIWHRDAQPGSSSWDFALDLSTEELKLKARECREKSWIPIELASYEVEPRSGVTEIRYAWISTPSTTNSPFELILNLNEDSYLPANVSWLFVKNAVFHRTGILDLEKGVLPVILSTRGTQEGLASFTQILNNVPPQRGLDSFAPSFSLAMPEDHFRLTLADFNIHHDLAWVIPEPVQSRQQYFSQMRERAKRWLQHPPENPLNLQGIVDRTRSWYELGSDPDWTQVLAQLMAIETLPVELDTVLALIHARAGEKESAEKCLNRIKLKIKDIRQSEFFQAAVQILLAKGKSTIAPLDRFASLAHQYDDVLSRFLYCRLLCIAVESMGITSDVGRQYLEKAWQLAQPILHQGTGPGYELDQFWSRDFAPLADKLEPLIQQKRQQLRYSVTWSPSRGMNQHVQHGETADLALPQWQRWLADGYIPHTIAAIEWKGKTRLMTAWRMARSTTQQDTAAANRRANLLLAAAQFGQLDDFWKALETPSNNNLDVELAHELMFRYSLCKLNPAFIVARILAPCTPLLKQRLLIMLGQYPLAECGPDHARLLTSLADWYCADTDSGIHSTCEWLLRTWKQDAHLLAALKSLNQTPQERETRSWYLSPSGHDFVVFRNPPTFYMGISVDDSEATFPHRERPHFRNIGHSFALASKEVTRRDFLEFKPIHDFGDTRFSSSDDCPIGNVRWSDAIAYCNWLSKRERIPEDQWCYELDKKTNSLVPAKDYLLRTGYRLPLESEFEYASRGNTRLIRFFGNSTDRIGKFAWFKDNAHRQFHPAGKLPPNCWGLFDVFGNATEWVSDRMDLYPAVLGAETIQDQSRQLSPLLLPTPASNIIVRSMSWSSEDYFIRSSYRSNRAGNSTVDAINYGFRVAKTVK